MKPPLTRSEFFGNLVQHGKPDFSGLHAYWLPDDEREEIRRRAEKLFRREARRMCKLQLVSVTDGLHWFWLKRDSLCPVRKQAKANAHGAKRRAQKLNATPPWLSEAQRAEIAAVYLQAKVIESRTSVPHHVDHIVPLQHPLVCGLHVPWNLQAIPANDNIRKGNRFDCDAA